VPTLHVSGVILNVTVTGTSAASYLSVWPQGVARPVVSSLNWTPGMTVANLVEVAVSASGRVSFFNAAGSTHLIVDVQGYVGDATNSFDRSGLFHPVTPGRDLDTRLGIGAPMARLGAGQTLDLTVTNLNGVPASGVSAVVLNVTAVNPDSPGYLTVWPTGATQPTASNLNFLAGQVVPNRVTVGVGASGRVSIFNPSGTVDVVADVNGWFTDGTSTAGGSAYVGEVPIRIFDTRDPADCAQPCGILGGSMLPISVTSAYTPPRLASVLNVTVVSPTQPGYLTVYPDDGSNGFVIPPLASDLNFVAGQVVPNMVVVKLGPNGPFRIDGFDTYNPAGNVNVVYDEDGFYGQAVVSPPLGALRNG